MGQVCRLHWLHQAAGLQPISGATLVQAALAGFRHMLAQPKVRKEPVTADMLKAMVDAEGPEPSLSEVRLLAVCLLAFAGFLHCEELLRLMLSLMHKVYAEILRPVRLISLGRVHH